MDGGEGRTVEGMGGADVPDLICCHVGDSLPIACPLFCPVILARSRVPPLGTETRNQSVLGKALLEHTSSNGPRGTGQISCRSLYKKLNQSEFPT